MADALTDILVERLYETLDYDPEAGAFTWRERPREAFKSARAAAAFNAKFAGRPAGQLKKTGYIVIRLDRRTIMAGRVAWAMMTGEWPKQQIDHINRIKTDNRFANLRDVSQRENNLNRAPFKRTPCRGLRRDGVDIRRARWRARIGDIHIGMFDTREEAIAAREREYERRFGN